jgi:cellulose synthase/poly-beta-1,6-N-acetylglucosamine synthase-like glycosyltransferase
MRSLFEIVDLGKISAVITFIFLMIVLSYYFLLIKKGSKPKIEKEFSSITVIIPAHNEEGNIRECIEAVIAAEFKGRKQIIVVDDGSSDGTATIAGKFSQVQLIKTRHSGKSASINKALSHARGELVAIVDGDSIIHKDALQEMASEVGRKNIAAASCPIRVRNRKKHVLMWVHIEQLYNSLMRSILAKVNANITTPGPLSVYRKKELIGIGGFSTDGFSEDVDVTIRLIRKGYKIGFAENAIVETIMPSDAKGFLRQRTRFARGLINILKKHMKFNRSFIDLYTLPIFLFSYLQAVIMGSFTVYQIIQGYITYFAAKDTYFSFHVLSYFIDWFSILGFIKWAAGVFTGATPLTLINIAGIASTLLSYPLFIYAIIKYDKKFDIWHLIPILFMAPFWWLIMIIYIFCLPEVLMKKQQNIWKKNE